MKYDIVTFPNKFQTTIKNPFSFKGVSIVSGKNCEAQCLPALADQGIVFRVNNKIITASYKNLYNESLHTTTLKLNGIKIKSVEHLLSAFWGMDIDNVIIDISKEGIPFFDFSAEHYAKMIKKAGIIKLQQLREYIVIKEKIKISFPDDDRYAIFYSQKSKDFAIKSTTDFPSPIGRQTVKLMFNRNKFLKDISWARSFVRTPLDEKGEKWNRIRKLYPMLPKNPKESPLIVYDKNEYVSAVARKNEPARHKVLDFIGDMSLLQKRIIGKVVLFKPGHKFTYKILEAFL